MHRRNFLRIVGGGSVFAATASTTLLAGCSSQLPTDAIAAWNVAPESPDTKDPRHWILSHALLAPHSHNLQSWLVDLSRPEEITLFMDRRRMLPETDPESRQMIMSQGTFLELLDLAARQSGFRADISLFPAGAFDATAAENKPIAHIRLTPDAAVKPDPLFAQVLRRHTNREPYEPRLPSQASLQAIAQSSAGMRTGFATADQPDAIAEHRRIAKEAWRIELQTPRTVIESLKVLRIGPDEISKHRNGLSANEPLLRALNALGLFDRSIAPGPDDPATQTQIKKFNAAIDATPAFYWLVTEGNDRVTQIKAGRAWVRAQLAATAQGLSMQPLSQALQEYEEARKVYEEIHEQLQAPMPRYTVQMWARLGYGASTGPSPRMGLDAHLLTPSASPNVRS